MLIHAIMFIYVTNPESADIFLNKPSSSSTAITFNTEYYLPVMLVAQN